MKTFFALLFCTCSLSLLAQVKSPGSTKATNDFFITTNSGVLNTPVGLKIGFIGKPGLYVGFRHGIGDVYHSDSDLTTTNTNLFSFTAGVNFPIIVKGDFRLISQAGIGYGQWWGYRWERWTRSGYELEAGLMIQKKSFLFNITGNVLNGEKTYPTGDVCVGVGFIMNRCR